MPTRTFRFGEQQVLMATGELDGKVALFLLERMPALTGESTISAEENAMMLAYGTAFTFTDRKSVQQLIQQLMNADATLETIEQERIARSVEIEPEQPQPASRRRKGGRK